LNETRRRISNVLRAKGPTDWNSKSQFVVEQLANSGPSVIRHDACISDFPAIPVMKTLTTFLENNYNYHSSKNSAEVLLHSSSPRNGSNTNTTRIPSRLSMVNPVCSRAPDIYLSKESFTHRSRATQIPPRSSSSNKRRPQGKTTTSTTEAKSDKGNKPRWSARSNGSPARLEKKSTKEQQKGHHRVSEDSHHCVSVDSHHNNRVSEHSHHCVSEQQEGNRVSDDSHNNTSLPECSGNDVVPDADVNNLHITSPTQTHGVIKAHPPEDRHFEQSNVESDHEDLATKEPQRELGDPGLENDDENSPTQRQLALEQTGSNVNVDEGSCRRADTKKMQQEEEVVVSHDGENNSYKHTEQKDVEDVPKDLTFSENKCSSTHEREQKHAGMSKSTSNEDEKNMCTQRQGTTNSLHHPMKILAIQRPIITVPEERHKGKDGKMFSEKPRLEGSGRPPQSPTVLGAYKLALHSTTVAHSKFYGEGAYQKKTHIILAAGTSPDKSMMQGDGDGDNDNYSGNAQKVTTKNTPKLLTGCRENDSTMFTVTPSPRKLPPRRGGGIGGKGKEREPLMSLDADPMSLVAAVGAAPMSEGGNPYLGPNHTEGVLSPGKPLQLGGGEKKMSRGIE